MHLLIFLTAVVLSSLVSSRGCSHLKTTFTLKNPPQPLPAVALYIPTFNKETTNFNDNFMAAWGGAVCEAVCGPIVEETFDSGQQTYKQECVAARVHKNKYNGQLISFDKTLNDTINVKTERQCNVSCSAKHGRTCTFEYGNCKKNNKHDGINLGKNPP
ncbi:hypothetical protein FKW77_010337 [Venturia effusa]|uniref:Uncharacterized protein n=1 Tax=Venturia effusa TaxID=50376 RepID=A0A517KXP6_9PEZI|nr:hypothetical protein FKW77_010337 [Venturia effusa]